MQTGAGGIDGQRVRHTRVCDGDRIRVSQCRIVSDNGYGAGKVVCLRGQRNVRKDRLIRNRCAALIAGVTIGLLQALTSIQEMTLTFVPKLGAIIGIFWITMAFMSETLVGFFQSTLIPIIAGG